MLQLYGFIPQANMDRTKDVKTVPIEERKYAPKSSNPLVEKNRRRVLNNQISKRLGLDCELDTGKSRLFVGNIDKLDLSPELLSTIQSLNLPRHHPIEVYNKIVNPKRECQFFSNDAKHYSFSGAKAASKPLTDELSLLLKKVKNVFQDGKYNGILVNRYLDQSENIGQHSDDERELGDAGVVALVFGSTRVFRIHRKYRDDKNKLKTKIEKDIELPHGSLVWMEGDFQKEFKHSVPSFKAPKGPRISFTFRYHK